MGNLISYIKKLFNTFKSYFNFFNFFNFKFFLFFSIFSIFFIFYFFQSIIFYYNEIYNFFSFKKKVINNSNNIINTENTFFNFIDELNNTPIQTHSDLKIYICKLTNEKSINFNFSFNLHNINEITPFDTFLKELSESELIYYDTVEIKQNQ